MSAAAAVSHQRGDLLQNPQYDYNHVSDKEYVKFRKLADDAYNKRSKYSKESQQAYNSGDKENAHKLSLMAKEQASIAENYNKKAAEYVFIENNRDSDDNDIDLHGLYVKEAEYILKQRIISGIKKNQSTLDCIVGKGLHSKDGIAKLKPAVEQLCNDAKLKCWIDKNNSGILHIDIKNASIPQTWYNVESNGVGAMDQTYYSYHPGEQENQYQTPNQYQNQYPNQYQNQNYHQQQQQQQQQQPESNTDCSNILILAIGALFKSFCR